MPAFHDKPGNEDAVPRRSQRQSRWGGRMSLIKLPEVRAASSRAAGLARSTLGIVDEDL